MPAFRLCSVEFDTSGSTIVPYPAFQQLLDEPAFFNGRYYLPGAEWTGGVLYPTYLGISFAERVADVPEFVAGVEALVGPRVDLVSGTASISLPGDPPLLGDWIVSRRFNPARLARTFADKLGGIWVVNVRLRSPTDPQNGYYVDIRRTSRSVP